MITLVLGGARSGKSQYAQALAARAADVVFLATAQPGDDDMRARIERHRQERPDTWKTVEAPIELESAVREHGARSSFLLIDCLTMFATNLMLAGDGDRDAIFARIDRLCGALRESSASAVIVSNEVGEGIVPAFEMGRQFRDLLGEINQRVARQADNVILMVAGYPLAVKGAVEVQP
ncbi:MAG: bifunctional adenosylcobinamide kinase/adenosylcobinamide-phosphate guanylyltransferase [Acidobacteriia bacterium]|nr:bifunctional adenosylcobinamide kinase/adenosylcobinamide-phosphate guanylyltransferase [Terriglobia bacterium]